MDVCLKFSWEHLYMLDTYWNNMMRQRYLFGLNSCHQVWKAKNEKLNTEHCPKCEVWRQQCGSFSSLNQRQKHVQKYAEQKPLYINQSFKKWGLVRSFNGIINLNILPMHPNNGLKIIKKISLIRVIVSPLTWTWLKICSGK